MNNKLNSVNYAPENAKFVLINTEKNIVIPPKEGYLAKIY